MKRGQPIHPVTDLHDTMLKGYLHVENVCGTKTLSDNPKTQSPELIELIAAARAFLPSDDVAFVYHDADAGESYRTCCHAVYRYYPHNRKGNPHSDDCAAVRLAAALAVFEAAT